MKVAGPLKLNQELYCKYEVLGKTYKANISGIDVCISFPQYNEVIGKDFDRCTGITNPLLPPEIAKSWRLGGKMLEWGYPRNYPDKDSAVSLLAISAECEDDKEDEIAQTLYNAIDKWVSSFFQYCILSSGQRIADSNLGVSTNGLLQLLGKNGYIGSQEAIYIRAFITNHKECLSSAQIENAISFASSGKELLLEYQMMLAAHEARDNERNRQAIIDACSALELCFVKRISEYCREHDIEDDILLEKYRSLGERYKLINQIDDSFNIEGIKETVIYLRNSVAHNKNIFPNNAETSKLINKVEECLEFYYTDFYEKTV